MDVLPLDSHWAFFLCLSYVVSCGEQANWVGLKAQTDLCIPWSPGSVLLL